jgi:riboflavin synthase
MFTGIISDIGTILSIKQDGTQRHLHIETAFDTHGIALGASIACSGICLTVTETGPGWFAATASEETCRITTLSDWTEGMRINLERALKAGDELGGHLVSGHVDGKATLEELTPVDDCMRLRFSAPRALLPYIATKGSVALDGISLTVNEADGEGFSVMIIPHTLAHTTLQYCIEGNELNLEVDMFARYAARRAEFV